MLTAIQCMTHKIRTGYGDSDVQYGNDQESPLQGGGQGNGASLSLWLAISCILLSVLESAVTGVHVYSSISLQLLSFIAIIYVDDTDILLTDISGKDTLNKIFQRAFKAAQVWQKAVHDSGGAVRPDKCYWTAVDFVFTAGKWRYMKYKEFDEEIMVKNTDGVYELVERYDINSAKEGLGIFVTPNGAINKQLKKILLKVHTWSDRLHQSFLNQRESYIGANSTIFKTIEYVLPGTSFTQLQCQQIERALYRHLMGKLGLSTKCPLAYKFGPPKVQGAALLEVCVSQMIGKLIIFLYQSNIRSQLSNTFTLSMEAIQIEVGSTTQFFSLQFQDYGCLTPASWLSRLWESLSNYDVTLSKPDLNMRPPREFDFTLMYKATMAKVFTREELCSINRCRLYLQVFYLSDIASGNGRKLLREAYEGQILTQQQSKWQWPR